MPGESRPNQNKSFGDHDSSLGFGKVDPVQVKPPASRSLKAFRNNPLEMPGESRPNSNKSCGELNPSIGFGKVPPNPFVAPPTSRSLKAFRNNPLEMPGESRPNQNKSFGDHDSSLGFGKVDPVQVKPPTSRSLKAFRNNPLEMPSGPTPFGKLGPNPFGNPYLSFGKVDEVRAMQLKVEAAHNKLAARIAKVEHCQADIKAAQQQVLLQATRIEPVHDTPDSKVSAMQLELNAAHEGLAEHGAKVEHCQADIKAAQQQALLQATRIETVHDTLDSKMNAMQVEANEARNKLAERTAEVEQCQADIKAAQERASLRTDSFAVVHNALDRKVGSMQLKLDETRNDLAEHTALAERRQDEIKATQQQALLQATRIEAAHDELDAKVESITAEAAEDRKRVQHQLQELQAQLCATQRELRQERNLRNLREKGLSCLVCGARAVGIRGIQCDTGLHFLCEGCLSEYVMAMDEVSLTEDGNVPCSVPSCNAESLSSVERYLSDSALDSLKFKRKKATERQAIAEVRVAWEAERERELARSAEEAAVKKAKDFVENELLVLKCPNGHPFGSFDGCCALTCHKCKPDVYFCAWCLESAVDSPGAHRHVAGCSFRRSDDIYFCPVEVWEEATLERQRQQFNKYLVDEVASKHTHAVKETIRKVRPDLLTTPS